MDKTYDLQQRIYLRGPLRYLPFGLGYSVGQTFKLQTTQDLADIMAKGHGAERNAAGWKIETVVVSHKGGKER